MKANQSFGLIMIVATLVVMAVTVYLLFDYRCAERELLARAQSLDSVRLFGGISWRELRSAGWLAQQFVDASNASIRLIESHALVFDGGGRRSFAQLGYFGSQFNLNFNQMPFPATLLLPIFLLAPLLYFRPGPEIKPLKPINGRIDRHADKAGSRQVELQPSRARSDIQMPLMTGEEFCLPVEAYIPQRNSPMFVLTALTVFEFRAWSHKTEGQLFLEKSASVRKLVAKLADCLVGASASRGLVW